MPNTVDTLVREYLKEAKLMQIATVKDGKPWVASVWYANDDKLNLYFISRKTRRHSLELKDNTNVAGTIVKPHTIGSGEKVRGLQFEGIASECTNADLETASTLYLQKYPTAEKIPLETLRKPDFIAAFYIIKPKMFVLFDEVNYPDDPRQEMPVRG
jgi:uncharacterized protein YhbP (UPF0306 family)